MEKATTHQLLAREWVKELKQKTLEQNLSSVLAPYSPDERESLARCFFHESKELILKGESKAFEVFELARKMAPLSSKLQYEQGLFLFNYAFHKESEKYLLLALKHVEKASQMDPTDFEACYLAAEIQTHLGLAFHEPQYFHDADQRYKKAELLTLQRERDALPHFYWDWGLSCYFLSKHSGEAVDVHAALGKFEKVRSEDSLFLRDYGNAWAYMGHLIEDPRYIQKSLLYYQKAVPPRIQAHVYRYKYSGFSARGV